MADERALNFRCPKSVPGHIQDIIDPAHDPKIAVFVAPGTVARQVIALKFAPILLSITRFVPEDGAQHRRPRAANNKFSPNVRTNFAPVRIDYSRVDSKEGECRAAWLCRNCTWQRRNEDRARFCLPPSIDNRATTAADP